MVIKFLLMAKLSVKYFCFMAENKPSSMTEEKRKPEETKQEPKADDISQEKKDVNTILQIKIILKL